MRPEAWDRRPVEEANLFNPPFLCSLTFEFAKNYIAGRHESAPLTLVVVGLAASLHPASRERLPYSTITSLYEWLQQNEDLLIGFSTRAKNISPHIKEAVLFGLSAEALTIGPGHGLRPHVLKAGFPKSFLDSTTKETKSIIERTKFMGRWLSKSGSEVSIAAAWGISP